MRTYLEALHSHFQTNLNFKMFKNSGSELYVKKSVQDDADDDILAQLYVTQFFYGLHSVIVRMAGIVTRLFFLSPIIAHPQTFLGSSLTAGSANLFTLPVC